MADCCNHFNFTDDGDSFQSWQGLRGPYYIPHISADGVLSWTNTGSLPNPAPVDISGPPGSSVELRGPVPSVEDLPDTAPSGELWLVGSASPYDGWFYNGVSWENAGQIAVGPQGPQGPAGADGTDGSDGVTFTPTVSSAGVISWTNDGGLPNPDPVDIKGPQGQTGAAGSDGSNGVTFTPAVSSAGVISWTNDGGLPNPDPVDIIGPRGPQGRTGPAGQDGTDGSNGVTFTPAVSSAGVISWTNDGSLPNPDPVNIKGPQGETGATGPAGPGVPSGGSTGQVLTKTGAADYATGWQDPSGGDVTADMLGIVIDGNSTPVGASAGQYVIVKNSTISGVTDGLYTAAQIIPANTAIDSTYLTPVDNGGFNSLGDKLSKYGKVLWDGNLSGAGSITVPDLDSYALVGIISGTGYQYMMVGNPGRGGMLYGVHRNNTIAQLAYRFAYVNNTLSVTNDERGIVDGTNSTYSGSTNCALIRVIGLIPYN